MSYRSDDEENGEWVVEIETRNDLESFVDDLISNLDEFHEGTDIEEVYEHVAFANYVFERTDDIMYSAERGSLFASKSKKLMNKLKKWLGKLRSKVASIAQNENATTFSVTVGTPFTVSVSLSFTP